MLLTFIVSLISSAMATPSTLAQIDCRFENSSSSGQRVSWAHGRITYSLDLIILKTEGGEHSEIVMSKAESAALDPASGIVKVNIETMKLQKRAGAIDKRFSRRSQAVLIQDHRPQEVKPCQTTPLSPEQFTGAGFARVKSAFAQFEANQEEAIATELSYYDCLKMVTRDCAEHRRQAVTAAAARDHEWLNIALNSESLFPLGKRIPHVSNVAVFHGSNGFVNGGDRDLLGVLLPQGNTAGELSADTKRWALERAHEEEIQKLVRSGGYTL